MAVKLPLDRREDRSRGVDIELIRELASVLDDTGLTEIEIGEGERRIRIARTAAAAPAAWAPPAPPAPAAEPAAAADDAEAVPDASHPGAVTSPMVGVVYRAAEPGAEPFISVGDTVSEGQTLFIVEAMKTMNPIRAPRGGRVARILAENGAPVEYGEVLLILE